MESLKKFKEGQEQNDTWATEVEVPSQLFVDRVLDGADDKSAISLRLGKIVRKNERGCAYENLGLAEGIKSTVTGQGSRCRGGIYCGGGRRAAIIVLLKVEGI